MNLESLDGIVMEKICRDSHRLKGKKRNKKRNRRKEGRKKGGEEEDACGENPTPQLGKGAKKTNIY